MSTKYTVQQALVEGIKGGVISQQQARKMLWALTVDPHTLAGDPLRLKAHTYWEKEGTDFLQSPFIQRSITPAGPPTAPTPQRSINIDSRTWKASFAQPKQSAPVQQARPKSRQATAYLQQPSKPTAQTQKADLISAPNLATTPVQRSQTQSTRRPVQKAATAQPVQRSAPAQGLPISPYTGQPSQIRAVVLRSLGEAQPALNQPQYFIDQQVQTPMISQAETAISPITGKPSSLTALVRRSVGL